MINWIYQWYKPEGALTGDAIVRQYTEIFFRGALG
jgi:Tetracyclin repressor-like, C-terminal domain